MTESDELIVGFPIQRVGKTGKVGNDVWSISWIMDYQVMTLLVDSDVSVHLNKQDKLECHQQDGSHLVVRYLYTSTTLQVWASSCGQWHVFSLPFPPLLSLKSILKKSSLWYVHHLLIFQIPRGSALLAATHFPDDFITSSTPRSQ